MPSLMLNPHYQVAFIIFNFLSISQRTSTKGDSLPINNPKYFVDICLSHSSESHFPTPNQLILCNCCLFNLIIIENHSKLLGLYYHFAITPFSLFITQTVAIYTPQIPNLSNLINSPTIKLFRSFSLFP